MARLTKFAIFDAEEELTVGALDAEGKHRCLYAQYTSGSTGHTE